MVPRDFYEIQESQRAKSLLLFGVLIVFYFVGLGLISLALIASFGLILSRPLMSSGHFWLRFLAFDLAAAIIVAVLHFLDARRNGARYILCRLQAATPDPADRYHKQFLDTVDEIRIAAGLPRVNAYVLPSFAVNSMALIEVDGTPAVAVTEGLLADCTRDELQAVAAHEIAHIARGDAFYLTLVCSLANLFEKLREALEPERESSSGFRGGYAEREAAGAPPFLLYFAASLAALVMHLLSALISRERELLADAAAVEICRSPESLARAIYKAHVKNSFVGDFSQTYTPLFIIPPDARDIPDTLAGRIFNTHPPLMKRIAVLAAMARKSPAEIIDEVHESERTRGRARGILHSFEEIKRGQLELFPGSGIAGPAAGSGTSVPEAGTGSSAGTESLTPGSGPANAPIAATGTAGESRVWLIGSPMTQKWDGPFTLAELFNRPGFSQLMTIRNVQEGIEAKAREFPQVRLAARMTAARLTLDPARRNKCPRCHVPLIETFYEGVAIRLCPGCTGKLVDMATIDRIIARRELGFSEDLKAKARAFKEKVLLNPIKKMKMNDATGGEIPCPNCGYRMVLRPYNYQYFIPVDKCLSCSKIWFDSDELEILQILIEEHRP